MLSHLPGWLPDLLEGISHLLTALAAFLRH